MLSLKGKSIPASSLAPHYFGVFCTLVKKVFPSLEEVEIKKKTFRFQVSEKDAEYLSKFAGHATPGGPEKREIAGMLVLGRAILINRLPELGHSKGFFRRIVR